MLKIWAKTMVKDKITRDYLYVLDEKFDIDKLMQYLIDICYEFDIPTPIILSSHTTNFDKFNITRFKERDFVESIDFETLVIENASE